MTSHSQIFQVLALENLLSILIKLILQTNDADEFLVLKNNSFKLI